MLPFSLFSACPVSACASATDNLTPGLIISTTVVVAVLLLLLLLRLLPPLLLLLLLPLAARHHHCSGHQGIPVGRRHGALGAGPQLCTAVE